jgi:prophage regulatory protein
MEENDRALKIREVSEIVTVSARKIWRDVADKKFPPPFKLGPKTTRWWESEVKKFMRGEWPGQGAH